MSATISTLVSGAATGSPFPPAATMDPPATQPLAPSQLDAFPSRSVCADLDDPSSATFANSRGDGPSAALLPHDDPPRPRANSMPTSRREVTAAEARQAEADASGKGVRHGWKKRWRKLRTMFKAIFRAGAANKPDAGSPVVEKDDRGLLMVPKRKHKPAKEELPPLPPLPAHPHKLPTTSVPMSDTDVGVQSAPNHPLAEPSLPALSHAEAEEERVPQPRIPAIPFPSSSSPTPDTELPPHTGDDPPVLSSNPPQLLITLDDGYVYEAFTIERAHVVFPRRSTDSTVPTVDRRRRVRRRSKTPAAADAGDADDIAAPDVTEVTSGLDNEEPLPSPVESLGRSAALAFTLGRMLRSRRGSAESTVSLAKDEEEHGHDVTDPRGYCTATDTESDLGSPAVAPSELDTNPVPLPVSAADKLQDEAVVNEPEDSTPPAGPPAALAPDTSPQALSLDRSSMSSFDLEDLAQATPLPLSPTYELVSSSPTASSVSLTPSDSGVTQDQDDDEPAHGPHNPIFDSGTQSDDHDDAQAAASETPARNATATTSPPSIQITLDDGFAYDAFTIERAHKVFPRRAADPAAGVSTIDRRRRVRRRSDVGRGDAPRAHGPSPQVHGQRDPQAASVE